MAIYKISVAIYKISINKMEGCETSKQKQKVNRACSSFLLLPNEQPRGKSKIIYQICFRQVLCRVSKTSPSKTNAAWRVLCKLGSGAKSTF